MSVLRLLISHVNYSNIVQSLKPNHNYSRQLATSFVLFNSDSSIEKVDKRKIKAEPVDRTKIIPVETSANYLKSDAYRTTYGDKLVWEQYRRNHKGAIPPRKTRKTCIRKGVLSTGNPCPICRDEYLVLDHRNLDLLKQFISPHSGEVLSYRKTGLCQTKHQQLLIAVDRAMDCGLITFDVPFRHFDYAEYYSSKQ